MNTLKEFINSKTQHFVAKHYIKAKFDEDAFVSKYEVYYKAQGKGRWNPMCETHKGLRYITLNEKEIHWLLKSLGTLYKVELQNKHGIIYVNNELGFDK
jgi:hypothetical protein